MSPHRQIAVLGKNNKPRWTTAVALAAALAIGTLPVIGLQSAAAADDRGADDFATSFEADEPKQPFANKVENSAAGKPIQENVDGGGQGSALHLVKTVTASAENPPNEAARFAADGDSGTKWLAFAKTAWLQYELTEGQTVSSYSITSGNDAEQRDPRDWTVQGSNNGTTWDTIDTQTGQSWKGSERKFKKSFTVESPKTYTFYRLDITANQSGDLLQLADWDLVATEQQTGGSSPMVSIVGGGPSSGYNIKARVGFTGMQSLKYSGGHTIDGPGNATNRLFDVDIPVAATTRLSYNIFPELSSSNLQYPSTHAAIDLRFTDSTLLSELKPVDVYGVSATASGQGEGAILYPSQWNNVKIDVGRFAEGKTISAILFSYDNPGATTSTIFQGWVDDIKVEAEPELINPGSLTNYVDTRRGTNSSGSFSRGSNEAITSIPNGFNFLVPLTNAGAQSREYLYQASNDAQNKTPFEGLGISHEPSPWMGDRNQFSVMPVTGAAAPSGNWHNRAVTFSHDNETAQPDYYGVNLDNKVRAEMTPTNRGMVMRFTFPDDAGSVVLDSPTGDGSFTIDAATGRVSGWIDKGSGFIAGQSRMFVSGTFDQAPTAIGTAAGGRTLTKYAAFDTSGSKEVTLRLATSLISMDQAAKNLAMEVGTKTFNEVRAQAKQIWNERLAVIEVEGASDTDLVSVYSNLYRLNLYPNAQFENTGTEASPDFKYASPVSTPTGSSNATNTGAKIVSGKMYVNNGFWDTYRTTWPAYNLLYPDVAAELVDGFTEQYRDGGWVARWSSPGYADIMTGTSSDVAFADAYLRGVSLIDPLATYDAAVKNATTPSPRSTVGRKSLNSSIFLGYTPATQGESVSWGLEGYINDYGIGLMAEKLAEDPNTPQARRAELREEAEYFIDRSKSYVNMFDPAIEFFQARNADGSFSVAPDKYDPTSWWGPYTETNGWNFAFHAPQDPRGLANLYGGADGLEAKLDEFFTTPETSFGPIHEELEARDARFGQWGISNQPSHHIPFLYNATGEPGKGQAIVREAVKRSFAGSDIGQGYPGDEDNGEMSAWYLFSALGLYPLQVGSSEMTIVSPAFTKATVSLGAGNGIVINAPNNSHENVYVQSLKVDGVPYASTSIDSNLLSEGATLDFVMGDTPSTWGSKDSETPPSLVEGDELAQPLMDTSDPSIATTTSAGGENTSALTDNTTSSQVVFASGTPELTIAYSGTKQRPTFYTLTAGAAKADPSAWVLEGSNDDSTWIEVDSRKDVTFANRNMVKPFKVAKPGSYQSYRLKVTAGDVTISLAEIELLSDGTGAEAGDLMVKPANGLTASSGVDTAFNLGITSGGAAKKATDYAVTVNWGDGSATEPATVGDPKIGNFPITASHAFEKPGTYRGSLAVSDGVDMVSEPMVIEVSYLEAGGLMAAFDSVCIGDDGAGQDCDAKGISYPRQGLMDGGFEQGVEHDVPGTDLTFTAPVVPVGRPDNATGDGQVIRTDLGEGATRVSFIGAATEKSQDEMATVNFADGTHATTPMQFSDWTKGGNSGALAPYGNIEVVRSSYRLVGNNASSTPSFFFSTVPYEIPAGKTVESITMPKQTGAPGSTGRVHVFAIASNGAVADQSFTIAPGADVAAQLGEEVAPVLATGNLAVADAVAPKARVQWGDSTATEDAEVSVAADGTMSVTGKHTYVAVGRYPVSVTVYGGTTTKQVGIHATIDPAPPVYDPTLTATPVDGILPGESFTIAGTGYAPGESVSIVLQSPTAVATIATADGVGDLPATAIATAADLSPGVYPIVATGAVSLIPASTTIKVNEVPVGPIYDPSAWVDLSSARPGDTVTVAGQGFAPDEIVTFELRSTPIPLGAATVDRLGALSYSFAIPATASVGDHQIVLAGDVSAKPVTIRFTVTALDTPGPGGPAVSPGLGAPDGGAAGKLPTTGIGILPWVAAALGLGLLGAALLIYRKRFRGNGLEI